MSAISVQDLLDIGVTVWSDDDMRGQVEGMAAATFATLDAEPAPGGYRIGVWLRHHDAFLVEAVLERVARLLDAGPEPDGWYQVSTGNWQLTLRLQDDGATDVLAQLKDLEP